MKKKRIYMLLVLNFMIAFSYMEGNINVSAEETSVVESTGQTSVIYIPDEKQTVSYIPKENNSAKGEVNTGDSTSTWKYIGLVITSIFMLMYIINKKKGEIKNEKN